MPRKVFFSFHYKADSQRVAKIRNIGRVEGQTLLSGNQWEAVERGGDAAIQKWINQSMLGRSCTIVLAGSATAGRRWVTYEIDRSWSQKMGIAVVYIHGISDLQGTTTIKGGNPLAYVRSSKTSQPLSSIAKAYDPPGLTSADKYNWIAGNLGAIVEEAIRIRVTS